MERRSLPKPLNCEKRRTRKKRLSHNCELTEEKKKGPEETFRRLKKKTTNRPRTVPPRVEQEESREEKSVMGMI